MATYYLLQQKHDGERHVDQREFIDSRLHEDCIELAAVEADSWKQARQLLGG